MGGLSFFPIADFLGEEQISFAPLLVGIVLLLLVIMNWMFYARAKEFSNFNSTDCIGGKLRLHPTKDEDKLVALATKKLQEKDPKAEYSPPCTEKLFNSCVWCWCCCCRVCETDDTKNKNIENGNENGGKSQSKDKKKRSIYNFANVTAFLALALDILQLGSLAVVPEFFPEETGFAYGVEFVFLDVTYEMDLTYTTFYEAMSLIVFWLYISNVLMHAFWTNDYKYVNAIPLQNTVIAAYSGPLYMLLVQKCLEWLDCTTVTAVINTTVINATSTTVTQSVLDINPNIHCWEGEHSYYAGFATFFLVLYVLSATSIGMFFLETADISVDIRWREDYILLERNLKLMIMICRTFFSSYTT
jgi:hypothetical protein